MKNIYCLLFLIICQSAFSQLGINAEPENGTMLKISKDSDSDIIKINNKSKDILLLNKDGNLGISSINPVNKLVIENDQEGYSGVQFKTGFITNNIILSDQYGNAYIESKKFIMADFPNNQTGKLIKNMENNLYGEGSLNTPIYTDLSINLPRGQWVVNVDLSVDLYKRNYESQSTEEYIKYENVIVNDYSIVCSFYLNEDTESNREKRFTVESGLLLNSSPNQISSIIGLSQNNTNVKGRFLVNVNSDFKRAHLIANCVRHGLNGDELVDVGVRPFIKFNKLTNNQFFATPL